MKMFKLKGQLTVFTAISFYTVLGSVKCVVGITEINGRWFKTQARICDIDEIKEKRGEK